MKIAVTAMGKDLDAEVDPRFGRAAYLVMLDDNGNLMEIVDNSANRDAMRGAGIQASKMLADRKVDVLLTGHCGPNAFKTLKAARIKVGLEQTGTVREAFERLKRDEIEFADQPDVEAHW